ncbi:phosphatidylglycerol lysyltransferase domain-containing protein [Kitasatospora sp. MBT63]|uniref:phosphatidylglycerol lysyltransferase domain-containing protein n=1 Tax=Kitasatospora sp. MBT63 TaxID=1444768 RepID=UPI0007C82BBD|nr:phosphatidylglycerol lysyltransferase domain-containing protein [Kitasatospora sp. MBT63]
MSQAQQRTRDSRVARVSARLVVGYLRIVAALILLAVVLAPLRNQFDQVNTGDLYPPFPLTTGFTSFALAVFLAVMLGRGKRAAWWFAIILYVLVSLVFVLTLSQPVVRSHVVNWISTAITCAVTVALFLGRSQFQGRGAPGNAKLAVATAVLGLAVVIGGGTALVVATDTDPTGSAGGDLGYAVARVLTLSGDVDVQGVAVPRWVDVVVNLAGVLVFLLVLYVLFRAPKNRERLTADDEARLRALLEQWGERDSLGYFALRRDKAVAWSPSGKAAIAYRVVGGVSLASGDPIGDPEAWPGAIEPWLDQARANAWVPAVIGAGQEAGTVYARHGLDALELGDEAILEVAEFSLEGRAMRGLRQAYNRVQRAGYTTRIRRHADIAERDMAALVRLADHWRGGETERGFSMALGRLGDPEDGQCVMIECTDGDGTLRALLSFTPWGRDGLSLDLMRRDREADNGLLEFMVLDLVNAADGLGIVRISLNFAMFRAVFERGSRLGAGPVLRLWRAVLLFFSRWWQIESLYRANAKYRPIWEPRYLCFRKGGELPRIALASARAEGFLETPSLPAMFSRRHTAPAVPDGPAGGGGGQAPGGPGKGGKAEEDGKEDGSDG